MNKYLIVLLLLCASLAQASSTVVVVGGTPAAAPAGDSCTGGLLLSAYFENDADVTVGGGCSAGADSTWALNGTPAPTYSSLQAQSGTYSVYQNNSETATSNASIGVTTRDIFNEAEGTLIFYIYFASNFNTSYTTIFTTGSGDDYFDIRFVNPAGTANQCVIRFSDAGYGVDTLTWETNITTGSWHKIEVQWKSNTNPGLSLNVDDGTPLTALLDNMAWAASASAINIAQGTAGGGMHVFFLDSLKIYSTSDF